MYKGGGNGITDKIASGSWELHVQVAGRPCATYLTSYSEANAQDLTCSDDKPHYPPPFHSLACACKTVQFSSMIDYWNTKFNCPPISNATISLLGIGRRKQRGEKLSRPGSLPNSQRFALSNIAWQRDQNIKYLQTA